ncbi:magnesium/cobalt transporter CorA [Thiothrix nivea]|uniref:Magnesium transport protein CorA n=1 Tax=Thiothrix nivea (strain ATCC 35100 / DSM 5205 / JP2) TaxID=870187 RepID=A0A656HAM3_THINJ|nr:magnesium/cobalt transporter CorA [Thiothrix nivea]EIJ34081.1 magnesium and cobalt transport protein CorA [Thiothrix nivea DSM 5205]
METFGKRYHPPGTPPGTLARHGEGDTTRVCLLEYSSEQCTETLAPTPEQCRAAMQNDRADWLDVTGVNDPAAIRELGETFGLHPLALEDVLNSGQRPKIDFHAKHAFLILNLPHLIDDEIVLEQVSLFVGDGHLLSFCSGDGAAFEPVRQRLRQGFGRIRSRGVDYLLYALVDVIIDSAFPLLETLGEQIEDLEDQVLENPDKSILTTLHLLKRDLLLLRRALWPQREVISRLIQHDAELVDETMRPYFSDCYDHAVQVIDLIETYREMLSGMLDIYLSSLSNRMNDIMRVLTVIATLFIPLTFIVGVYGMNFVNMPELRWRYGYFIVWGIMAVLAIAMLMAFKLRKWL